MKDTINKFVDKIKLKIQPNTNPDLDLSILTSKELISEVNKRDSIIKVKEKEIKDLKEHFREKSIEHFKNRRSIRRFSDRPVDYEKIYDIVTSGLNAPVAGNVQNYRIIIIQDEKEKEECARIAFQQFWMTSAPYFIVITRDDTEVDDLYPNRGPVYSIQNVAAVIENIIMAAHMSDLGTCWVGVDDSEALKDFLGIPRHLHLDAIIPIGYAEGNPVQIPKQPEETMIYYEKFGNKSR